MGKKTLKQTPTSEKSEKKLNHFKEIDMTEIKSKIKEEYLVSYEMLNENEEHLFQTKPQTQNGYELRFKEYLTEEFNVKCVFLIMSFINSSQSLPSHLQKSQDFLQELLSIIRELMMNEFEIALYTMYIDEIGWEKKDFKTKLHLLCIGILTKCFTNRSIDLFINHFKKQSKDFTDFFLKWREDIKEPSFSTIEINERFKQLNKPSSASCQKNYIDYNSVVEKIIQLSQPFNEELKEGMFKDNIANFGNSLDLIKIPSFQPFQPFSFKMNPNDGNNDPLMLGNPNGMKSFMSVSSKKDEQEENYLDLFNSRSFVDNPLVMKQPSDFFNLYSNNLQKVTSSSPLEGLDFIGFNNANLSRMKSSLSNQAENRLFQPQSQPMNSFADVMKSFIKDK